jgi:hypothetical protein
VPSILTGWWRAAEAAASLVASPRTDVSRADAAAAGVIGRSALVIAASSVISVFERAWSGSTARTLVVRLGDIVPATVMLRTRFAAVIVMVAGVTALALEAVRPGPREPLAWLLPAMTVAAAAFVALAGALGHGDAREGPR